MARVRNFVYDITIHIDTLHGLVLGLRQCQKLIGLISECRLSSEWPTLYAADI